MSTDTSNSPNSGLNIIVCIKQVPDTTDVKINPETNTLVREGVKSIINPFDMYAIEEAVRLKEKFGGKTTAVSMGPPQADASASGSYPRRPTASRDRRFHSL